MRQEAEEATIMIRHHRRFVFVFRVGPEKKGGGLTRGLRCVVLGASQKTKFSTRVT